MTKLAVSRFFIFALLAGFLLLGGCATVGQPYAEENISQIRVGETTRNDIRELFGTPWRTGVENGQETWTYGHYRYRLLGSEQTTDLVVRFNEQGRVASYTYNRTLEPDEEPQRQYAP